MKTVQNPVILQKLLFTTLPFYLIGYGTLFLFTLLKIPFLTTVFTASELGNYAFINTLLTYIEVVFFSWVSGTIWRYVYEKQFSGFRNLATAALTVLFVLGSMAGITTFFLSMIIHVPHGDSILLYAFFSSFSSQLISFFLNYFLFKKWIHRWCMLICFQNIFSFLILVALITFSKEGIAAIFISTLLCNIILLVFFFFIYFRRAVSGISFKNISLVRKLLPYSSLLIFSNIFFTAINNGDRFIIDDYKGKQQLGVYSQNYSLASVGFFSVVQFFSLLFIPLYNKSLVGKEDETIKKIIQFYFILFTPLLCFFILNSEVITNILLGKEFRGYSVIFNWIAAGIYCFGITNFFEIRLKFMNRIRSTVIIIAIHALLNILLNLWLLRSWSIETAAVITFGTYCMMMIVFVIFNRGFFKQLGLDTFIPDLLYSSLSFIIIALLVNQYVPGNWFVLFINGISALVIYWLFLKKHLEVAKYCIKRIAF
jgi:O-antigen/teichoic acid export membrane protein